MGLQTTSWSIYNDSHFPTCLRERTASVHTSDPPPPIAHPVFALRQLSNHLRDILDYEDGERDLCLLHHIFQVELHDGREQRITSTLAAYGDPMGTPGAHNAMAKTVRTVEQS